jgi:hypothetical protein
MWVAIFLWSSLLFISSCITYKVLDGKKEVVTLSSQTLKENTRLSGHIRITGILRVPRGVILAIDPGTKVEFIFSDTDQDGVGDGKIKVEGTILADGLAEKPILFFGSRAGPKSWSEVLVEYSPASSLSYCEFRDAHWGLHIHYSPVVIKSCRFIENYGGLRFRSGPITVEESFFHANTFGIRYIAADPLIRGNTFRKNRTAIFIRQGSTDPVITANNFSDTFAIKLGESQQQDIPAANNFWGSTTISEVEKVIYDQSDSGYLGRVLYTPIATEPFIQESLWPASSPSGERK